MPRYSRYTRCSIAAFAALATSAAAFSTPLAAQADREERFPWSEQPSRPKPRAAAPRRDDAYRPGDTGPGLGTLNGTQPGYGAPGYGAFGGYAPQPAYRYDGQAPADAPQQGYAGAPAYGGSGPAYGQPPAYGRGEDAYRPPYRTDGQGYGAPAPGPYASNQGFGQPYTPPPEAYQDDGSGRPSSYARPPYRDDRYAGERTYSSNEILDAGHSFFGTVSKGLASAIEYVFQRQGRPNGYILGEDAGGAFVAGLRYGEGVLYTKDAGNHRVYWQGPSIGYDAGAEGSKVMVLVYNLRDPSEIYDRFPGVSGSAYVVGGVSLNFQAKDHIVLAPIRSGIGLRLGANVGYLKYTPRPTWNPF
jgi:hypothetical protein